MLWSRHLFYMGCYVRETIDALLSMIGATSLTDEEFDSIVLPGFALNEASYLAVLSILDSREVVSETRDRLTYYFLSRGVSVVATSKAKSNILIGGVL